MLVGSRLTEGLCQARRQKQGVCGDEGRGPLATYPRASGWPPSPGDSFPEFQMRALPCYPLPVGRRW